MTNVKEHKRRRFRKRKRFQRLDDKKVLGNSREKATLIRRAEKTKRRDLNSKGLTKEERRRGYRPVDDNEEINFDFNNNDVIDSSHEEAVSKIVEYWEENKSIVPISTVLPLLNDEKFIDFVLKNKVEFISQKEPALSKEVCNMMHYINKNYFGNIDLGKGRIEKATEFAKEKGPIIDDLKERGFKSSYSIAEQLDKMGIPSPRGKQWSSMAVLRVSKRWEKLRPKNTSPSKNPKPQ